MVMRFWYAHILLMISIIFPVSSGILAAASADKLDELLKNKERYDSAKAFLAGECQAIREMREANFFLFGMGQRTKYLYRDGALTEVFGGDTVAIWQVANEIIFPSEYTVYLMTANGREVFIQEDSAGVWLIEDGQNRLLSEGPVVLPEFEKKTYGPLLKVLLQEILVNIVPAGPVPNLFVYGKPWYRDAAMMCACLKITGNLHLVKDWILSLSELYDLNNGGDREPDNLGQALYMISLVSDTTHPLVPRIIAEARSISRNGFIIGKTDGSLHPVYQTNWLKYGLKSLGMADQYTAPDTTDSYASLFWMDFRPADNRIFKQNDPDQHYPYLSWARAHYMGEKEGWIVNNLDYPLTWESNASQADYQGMAQVSSRYDADRTCVPHTWHAAEMFLYLIDF